MKTTLLFITIIMIIVFQSCSVTDKFLGSETCVDEVDIAAVTFDNYKYKVSSSTSLITGTGLLNAADPSLNKNLQTVAGWVSGLPRLDKVHYEATKYFVSSNDNFLKAVGQKEILAQIEKEVASLGKTATEDEKQAKYLQILNDPKLQEKMKESSEKTDKISAEKKEFLDKAYIHLTYGIIYDVVTAGISSLVITETKSQIESVKNSISNPLQAAKKTRCLQKSLSRTTEIAGQAKDQVSPAINVYNSIVKIYSNSGMKLPEVANAAGKPIESDLP